MMVDTEIGVGSEELSITEASLEFGLSEALIRRAVHSGRLPRIAHRWRQRVRRVDVAALAASTQSQAAHPVRSPAHQPRTGQNQRAATQAEALRLVGELGEASVSQIQQRLASGGGQSITYFAAGAALRELAKEGKLGVARAGHRLLYHLRTAADDTPAAPPPPGAIHAPRPVRILLRTIAVQLTPLEMTVLEAMGNLGSANLDQLYRTLARPVGASYPEFVLVVRGLVQKGLAIRIKERNRYFYQAGE